MGEVSFGGRDREQVAAGGRGTRQSSTVTGVCKLLAISEQTYDTWRREHGGLKVDQAKRFKELEQENARQKRLLAEVEMDKAILREATSPNF